MTYRAPWTLPGVGTGLPGIAAHDAVRRWLAGRGGSLAGTSSSTALPHGHASSVQAGTATSTGWQVRVDTLAGTDRWPCRTVVTVFAGTDPDRVHVQVSSSSSTAAGDGAARRLGADLAGEILSAETGARAWGGAVLARGAQAVTRATLGAWLGLLCDPGRGVPVHLVAAPADAVHDPLWLDRAADLADATAGIALVATVDLATLALLNASLAGSPVAAGTVRTFSRDGSRTGLGTVTASLWRARTAEWIAHLAEADCRDALPGPDCPPDLQAAFDRSHPAPAAVAAPPRPVPAALPARIEVPPAPEPVHEAPPAPEPVVLDITDPGPRPEAPAYGALAQAAAGWLAELAAARARAAGHTVADLHPSQVGSYRDVLVAGRSWLGDRLRIDLVEADLPLGSQAVTAPLLWQVLRGLHAWSHQSGLTLWTWASQIERAGFAWPGTAVHRDGGTDVVVLPDLGSGPVRLAVQRDPCGLVVVGVHAAVHAAARR